jgi:hypothetical protein
MYTAATLVLFMWKETEKVTAPHYHVCGLLTTSQGGENPYGSENV